MDNECAHPPCNCPAPQGEKYCSTYCQDAGSLTELACNCGHRGCAEQMEASIDDVKKKVS